jgi:hypothetical protein
MSLKLRLSIALLAAAALMHWYQTHIDQKTVATTREAAAAKRAVKPRAEVAQAVGSFQTRDIPNATTAEIFRLANLFQVSIDSTASKSGNSSVLKISTTGSYSSTRGFLVAVHNSLPNIIVSTALLRSSTVPSTSGPSTTEAIRAEIELMQGSLQNTRAQIDDSTKNPFQLAEVKTPTPKVPSITKQATSKIKKTELAVKQATEEPLAVLAPAEIAKDLQPPQVVPKKPPSILGVIESAGKVSVIVLERGNIALKSNGDLAGEQWQIKEVNREFITWSKSNENLELRDSLKTYWNAARP